LSLFEESKVVEEASRSPGPFDVRTVKALVALMSQHDLNEIDLRDGTQRIRLRRGLPAVTVPVMSPVSATAPAPVPAPPQQRSETAAPKADGKKLVEIKSPTPGTFYAAPTPDAPPYVKAGSKVTPTSVVCQIEAMKIFNEIAAECTGAVVEVLVENQQAVEYGQVLFRVDPTS
jgi:acetyl-CoA carboxylase biotin carboxyl carrier protein